MQQSLITILMSTWAVLTVVIVVALAIVSKRLWSERHRHEFELVKAQATDEALASIKYETEVEKIDESGFFTKKTTLHIRERVLYKKIRIAEWQRTAVVKSEVTLENYKTVVAEATKAVDSVTGLVLALKGSPGASVVLGAGLRERLQRK